MSKEFPDQPNTPNLRFGGLRRSPKAQQAQEPVEKLPPLPENLVGQTPPKWETLSSDSRFTESDPQTQRKIFSKWAKDSIIWAQNNKIDSVRQEKLSKFIEDKYNELDSLGVKETVVAAAKTIPQSLGAIALSAAGPVDKLLSEAENLFGADERGEKSFGRIAKLQEAKLAKAVDGLKQLTPGARRRREQLDKTFDTLVTRVRGGKPLDENFLKQWEGRVIKQAAEANGEQVSLYQNRKVMDSRNLDLLVAYRATRDPLVLQQLKTNLTQSAVRETASETEAEGVFEGDSEITQFANDIVAQSVDPLEAAATAGAILTPQIGLAAKGAKAAGKVGKVVGRVGEVGIAGAGEVVQELAQTALDNPDARAVDFANAAKVAFLAGGAIGGISGIAGDISTKVKEAPLPTAEEYASLKEKQIKESTTNAEKVRQEAFDVAVSQGKDPQLAQTEADAAAQEAFRAGTEVIQNTAQVAENFSRPDAIEQVSQNPQVRDAAIAGALEPPIRVEDPGPSSSSVEVESAVEGKPEAIKEAALNILGKDSTLWVNSTIDSLNPLRALERLNNEGLDVDASTSAWKAALQTRNLSSVMGEVLRRGALSYDKARGVFHVPEGRVGLVDIFTPISDKIGEWSDYAIARSAVERLERKTGRSFKDISDAEIEASVPMNRREILENIQKGGNNPLFVQASEQLNKFYSEIRGLLVETGLISEQQAEALSDYQSYVPFFRDMTEANSQAINGQFTSGKGFSGKSAKIKKFKGSQRAIKPLLENIMAQTSQFVDAAMKNQAMQRAARLMEEVGVAREVPNTNAKGSQADPVSSAFKRLTENPESFSEKEFVDALMTLSPTSETSAGTVTVTENGVKRTLEVLDPSLLVALKDLGSKTYSPIMKMFLAPSRLLTQSITATPSFGAANFIRDTLSTWIQEPGNRSVFTHFGQALAGVNAALKDSKELQALAQSGSGQGFDWTIDLNEKTLDKIIKGQRKGIASKVLMAPKTALKSYTRVLQSLEQANRIATRRRALAAGKTEAEANFAAQDLLNFSMRGSGQWTGTSQKAQFLSGVAHTLIRITPFTNARIQGLYKLSRSLPGRIDPAARQSFLIKAALMTAASVALALYNDEDVDENGRYWFRELTDQDKLLYYHFRIPGTNEILRVPKPFEMGALFSSVPEIAALTAKGTQSLGSSASQLGSILFDTFSFNPAQTPVIKVPLEQFSNKTMFFGSQIVPAALERMTARYQIKPTTSATAQAIGAGLASVLGDDSPFASPVRIDAAAYQLLGGLSNYIFAATDGVAASALGIDNLEDPRNVVDFPVVGEALGEMQRRFLRNTETNQTRFSEAFYDLKDKVDQEYGVIRSLVERGDTVTAALRFEKNKDFLGLRARLNEAQKELSILSKEQNKVIASQIPKASKKKLLDRIASVRNEIYREVVGRGTPIPTPVEIQELRSRILTPARQSKRASESVQERLGR